MAEEQPPPYRQPFLHELATTLAAPTQVLSGLDGQLRATEQHPSAQGVVHADVRVVSVLELTVEGAPPEHIATAHGDAETTFVSLVRGQPAATADPQLRLDRRRQVEPGTVRETLLFTSALPQPVELAVVLDLAGDGAPMAAIRSGVAWPPTAVHYTVQGSVASWSVADTQVALVADEAEVSSTGSGDLRLRWSVRVPPSGQTSVGWQLTVTDRGGAVVAAAGEPLAVPELVEQLLAPVGSRAADARLRPWLTQSLTDLNGLRMAVADSPQDAFFAAGSPWYLTLFGRDSLWTARLLLPVDVRHAGSTLRALARRQGTTVDLDRAEQPGKILHELRRERFAFGDLALPPLYYGTIDATPLWVCLLHDAWRAGLAADEVRELMPACRAALRWVMDSAADGFLAYVDESGHGLTNQGWKDSADAVRFADGTLATGPVALVEVQGYAYEAARSGADLLDAFGLPGAEGYRDWARALAERFRASYWCGRGADRYPALALDGQGRRVDALTSNIGHLLGTGLLNAEEELRVARRLASPELDSGLGLRTMSSAAGGYWPLSYHCGSVWPHDTAITIAGMARSGLLEHGAGLVEGLLQAGLIFGGRLPELWSGEGAAVPFPAACRPQAWSAVAAVTVASALGQLAPAGSAESPPSG